MTQTIAPTMTEVIAAETEYLRAISVFGVDSAEAYTAGQVWRHLKRRYFMRRQSSQQTDAL